VRLRARKPPAPLSFLHVRHPHLSRTTELVLQSAGALTLDDVYGPYNASASEFPSVFSAPGFAPRRLSPVHAISADIYNAQPALGFYCLYRARAGDPAPAAPDCVNISATAAAHAAMLVGAGFDYVAVRNTRPSTPNRRRTNPAPNHRLQLNHTL